jgi:transcriptional regulator with XRE-family HTH domain
MRDWYRMDMRKLVGRNFARLRQAKGLTQEDVSARSGLSQQYLSGLENGRRNPTIITLHEIAEAIGVSHVDLVMPDQESGTPIPTRVRNVSKLS